MHIVDDYRINEMQTNAAKRASVFAEADYFFSVRYSFYCQLILLKYFLC